MMLDHLHATGENAVHPLLLIGFLLSAPVVAVSHGSTDWLGIAAFIAAVTGLITAIAGFAVTMLKLWLDYHNPPTPAPKRRR